MPVAQAQPRVPPLEQADRDALVTVALEQVVRVLPQKKNMIRKRAPPPAAKAINKQWSESLFENTWDGGAAARFAPGGPLLRWSAAFVV